MEASDIEFIAAAGRSASREQVALALATAVELRTKDSARVVGFDLVQEEDRSNTLDAYRNLDVVEAR